MQRLKVNLGGVLLHCVDALYCLSKASKVQRSDRGTRPGPSAVPRGAGRGRGGGVSSCLLEDGLGDVAGVFQQRHTRMM